MPCTLAQYSQRLRQAHPHLESFHAGRVLDTVLCHHVRGVGASGPVWVTAVTAGLGGERKRKAMEDLESVGEKTAMLGKERGLEVLERNLASWSSV